MNKKQIESYIRMRMTELEKCLDNPSVFNNAACKARWEELDNLLKVMGVR